MEFEKKLWCVFGAAAALFLLFSVGFVGAEGIMVGVAIGFLSIPTIFSLLKILITKKRENTPLTGTARKFHEIYMLAPSDSFARYFNQFGSEFLTSIGNQMTTSTLHAESEALLKEKKRRESSKDYYNVSKKMSYEQVISAIDTWVGEFVRPELIHERLLKILEMNLESVKDAEKVTIYGELLEVNLLFNAEYFKCMADKEGMNRMMNNFATDRIGNISTRGLGFGLITSSVGEAALFAAVDALERNHEFKSQKNHILSMVNSSERLEATKLHENVTTLYWLEYKKGVKAAIRKAYDLIESKN